MDSDGSDERKYSSEEEEEVNKMENSRNAVKKRQKKN